jgi:type I restriction enzyme S subunit
MSPSDNLPYEKVGKNEPVCIAEEVPFEIPESWEWARLKNLTIKEIKRGKSPKYADDGSVYVFAQKCNVKLGGIDVSLAKFLDMEVFDKYPGEEYMADGDIIINSTGNGTLGRIGIFRDSDRINDFVIVPDSHVTIIRTGNQMIKDYLFFALKYHQPYLEKLGEGSTNQTELRPSTVAELFIPVPPIGEQKRIVEKLLEVLPMADVYGIKEKSLQDYNTDFPVQLKKSILQEAVQGKLVPQDPADEPASVLLERIRAEKEQLIKAGKIKRDKHESVIFRRDNSHYEKRGSEEVCIDDEIPFDLPDSWEWIRLGSLVQVNPRNNLPDDTDVGFIPMPLLKEGFNNQHTFETRKWSEVKNGFTHFANGDVVIAKITPCFQNRKSAVIADLPNGYGAGTTELHVLRDNTHLLYMPYLLLLCKTHDFITTGMKNFTGTAGQQRVGKDFISNYLVPLPPVHEQKRIVETAWAIISEASRLVD